MTNIPATPEMRLKRVRMMADYQFGKGAGGVLFDDDAAFLLSKTKRIRQVHSGGERIATVRARDGFFTLSMEGARRLHSYLKAPAMRVVVTDEAAPFAAKGKTAFCKHVLSIDTDLRAMEEVMVTDKNDKLLATGQLVLSPKEVISSETGPAVFIRNGIEKEEKEEKNEE
ncbi:MAG: pseudouridine synthase [Methanimicrococcus sp.]|nr:pseudouridine synthase [Methanimicrococcus sp.]